MIKNYKAIILAGGYGTRYNRYKKNKILKPLVKVNKISILERVIQIYRNQGIKKFILLGGYKFDGLNKFSVNLQNKFEDLSVEAIFTGINTNTAGRLMKIKNKFKKNEIFFFTYGDSLANFNLKKSLKLKNKKNFVISLHRYAFPYGDLNVSKNKLTKIYEKNKRIPINAGFYTLDKTIFEYIKTFDESFEKKTINKIIKKKKKKI